MMDAEAVRFVRQEIERQLNVILTGSAGATDQFKETISNQFPGMPDIPGRPVMHPYGLVSRAPQGTLSVTGRMGEHVGNRMVLGHRDKNRPSLAEGEVMLYNEFGQQMYVKNGNVILNAKKVSLGSAAAAEPFVLGNVFQAMMETVLEAIATHTHASNVPSAPTSPPLNAAVFEAQKASPVADKVILSDEIFGEKSGGA